MKEIVKKCDKPFFDKILSGEKTFEIRLNDFDCKEGDILILKEFDREKNTFTGREIRKKVGYVLKTKDLEFWTKEEVDKFGYQAISLLD